MNEYLATYLGAGLLLFGVIAGIGAVVLAVYLAARLENYVFGDRPWQKLEMEDKGDSIFRAVGMLMGGGTIIALLLYGGRDLAHLFGWI